MKINKKKSELTNGVIVNNKTKLSKKGKGKKKKNKKKLKTSEVKSNTSAFYIVPWSKR